MDEAEYRTKHSELIEECIYIEDLLKRYYGLTNGKGDLNKFIQITDKLDTDPMGKLINIYREDSSSYFSKDFLKKLEEVKMIRNYYVHQVFYQHTPIKHKEVKKYDKEKLINSLKFIRNVHVEFCELYDNKVTELNRIG